MTKIVVYDAIMGNCKTERIIKDLSKETRPVIYITPLLSEVTRVSGAIVNDNNQHMKDDFGYFMYDEKHPLASKKFCLPNNRNSDGSKLTSIKNLIEDKQNICSTHKLFSMLDFDVISAIKNNNYILVVDEALEVWDKFSLYSDDEEDKDKTDPSEDMKGYSKTDKEIQALIKDGLIEVDPLGLLWWQDEKMPSADKTFYKDVKRFCDLKQLYISNGRVVYWELNKTVLSAFSEVKIATYMFKHSLMRHYLDIHGFTYKIENFGLKPCDYKKHVNIVSGRMNKIGDKDYSLSFSDLSGRKDRGTDLKFLQNNLFNFFTNMHNVKSKDNTYLWTVYKKPMNTIAKSRFKNGWIAYNTKATNQFINAEHVAYLCNNFPSTFLIQMVTKRSDQSFDQDMWALSEMLQFLFRSKLRMFSCEDRMINIYIPSKRMRTLFEWWLEQDSYDVDK